MPNPPTIKTAEGIWQVSFLGQWTNGQKMNNVCHWEHRTDFTGSELSDFLQKVCEAWQDEMLDVFPNNYTFLGLQYMNLDAVDGETGTRAPTITKPVVGQDPAVASIPSVSILVKKHILGAARNRQSGRMYLPPGPQDMATEDGMIGVPTRTIVQTKLTAFYNAVKLVETGTEDAEFVVVHWSAVDRPPLEVGGEWPAIGSSTVTALTVDLKAATQRRRLR